MKKELQDYVWQNCLPKEFKEEVKEIYSIAITYHPRDYNHKTDLLKYLFGYHNLTSDGKEEDEMLYVSRKQIDALQGEIFKAIMDAHDADDWQDAAHYILDVMPRSFAALFSSKCLPNELNEDNFAKSEPKPSEPKNEGTRQEQYVPKNAESGTHSSSHILKDDFRDHNRLHIAAMAMQGLISKTPRFSSYEISNLVRISLDCADALIKKAEGGSDE